MILTNGNISLSKIEETSQLIFQHMNIFAITIGLKVLKSNTIEYTKTIKYFHQII